MKFKHGNKWDTKTPIAGPGHNPLNPQPIPKIDEPIISFLSISLFEGIWNFGSNKGDCFWRISLNPINVHKIPYSPFSEDVNIILPFPTSLHTPKN